MLQETYELFLVLWQTHTLCGVRQINVTLPYKIRFYIKSESALHFYIQI